MPVFPKSCEPHPQGDRRVRSLKGGHFSSSLAAAERTLLVNCRKRCGFAGASRLGTAKVKW
jgi:hypothetical protein